MHYSISILEKCKIFSDRIRIDTFWVLLLDGSTAESDDGTAVSNGHNPTHTNSRKTVENLIFAGA